MTGFRAGLRSVLLVVAALGIVLAGCGNRVTATPATSVTPFSTTTAPPETGPTKTELTETAPTETAPTETPPTETAPPATVPPGPPSTLAELDGRTFRLVGLFTDVGGADTMFSKTEFVLHFSGTTAAAETHCGRIDYPHIEQQVAALPLSPLTIDLGQPVGPPCQLGKDPSDVPSGPLGFGQSGDEYWLSTGYVGWRFTEET